MSSARERTFAPSDPISLLDIFKVFRRFNARHLERKNKASSSRLLFANERSSRLQKQSQALSDCSPPEFKLVWSRFREERDLMGLNPEMALKSSSLSWQPKRSKDFMSILNFSRMRVLRSGFSVYFSKYRRKSKLSSMYFASAITPLS